MVTRLISATGEEIEKMSPMELKESVFKSEGRVVMGQHLLFAGEGLVRGITNSELMFAFGADMVMLNTFDLDNLDNNPGLCGLSFQELKKEIVASVEAMGLSVSNIDETRSRRDYNCYKAPFPSLYTNSPIVNSEIIVESYVALLPFPIMERNVENYIHDFLLKTDQEYLAEEYGLYPFPITTQSISRTFTDKVFAICDYYMTDRVDKHSRHLYDIHKIYTHPDFKVDDTLKQLIEDVRRQREGLVICPSAVADVNVEKLLEEIITTSAYEKDYHKITDKILFSPIAYNEVIESIKDIVQRRIFSKS